MDFFADRGERYAASVAKVKEADEACIARRTRHAESFNQFVIQQ
jgi:hypothetical protein